MAMIKHKSATHKAKQRVASEQVSRLVGLPSSGQRSAKLGHHTKTTHDSNDQDNLGHVMSDPHGKTGSISTQFSAGTRGKHTVILLRLPLVNYSTK